MMLEPLTARVFVSDDGDVQVESAPLLVVATVDETEDVVWENLPDIAGHYDWTGLIRTESNRPCTMVGSFLAVPS